MIRPDIGQNNSKTIWNLRFTAVNKLKKPLSRQILIDKPWALHTVRGDTHFGHSNINRNIL